MTFGMIVELFGVLTLCIAVILLVVSMIRQKRIYKKADEKYITDIKLLISNLKKSEEMQLKFKEDILKELKEIKNKLDMKK
ncbi:hypothetical protein [Caloranaerobacter sp. DY30410]|uniref:hypothetical protein n=1 Tax=Caloranaerobacter sp. DY30410 TaxID=3238305 RepID=UPI003CFFA1BB